MATTAERAAYNAGQWARIGWFFGNAYLTARLTRGTYPRPSTAIRPMSHREVLDDLVELVRRDRDNIDRGLYRAPRDLLPRPARLLAEARAYFRDLPEVANRRVRTGNAEVFREPPPGTPKLPRYYLQNFHYQTDGYLSEHSARLYDYQVEVLFRGGADAMRRQALVPIRQYLTARAEAGKPARTARLLDVACGTGGFLAAVKDNYPWMPVTGLDLSAPYLKLAEERLAGHSRVGLVQAPAEAIPMPDGGIDLVTCVYLYHELPRKIRRQAAEEMARVLAPGGRLVFVDSIQRGDRPAFDSILAYFPEAYYEPYYEDYTKDDLVSVFEGAGLRLGAVDIAFMSKILTFEKP
jgi:ubiquinone/menaquinone biosynthesis C-methylase UbiE